MMLNRLFSAANLWSLLAALLLVLSYPPTSVWPLSLASFAIFSLLVFEERFSRWELARLFFIFSFFTKACSLYWIPHTMIEFSDFPLPVAWLVGFLCFTLMCVPSALVGALLVPLARKWGRTRLLQIFCILVFWIVWDYFDYRFFSWVPAQSFGSQPQLLATAGIFGTGGWNFIFYGLIALLHRFGETDSGRKFTPRAFFKWGALVLAVLVAAACLGQLQIKRLKDRFSVHQRIALLQGAVGNFEKKLQNRDESPTNENVLRIYRDLIERLALKVQYEEKEKNLFAFWPETSFPGFPLNDTSLSELLSSWARLTHAFQLIGAYEEESAPSPIDGRARMFQYNIVAAFSPTGDFRGHYRKMQRMPFGEYVPGDQYYPWIYEKFPFFNLFGKGERYVPIPHDNPKGPVFLPFICFEILQEDFVKEAIAMAKRDFPDRDLILVNPTNDSWFGEGAELFLHSHLARWQAARAQLPLVRPTNTGLSMVIAPWGEILSMSRVGVESLIMTDLPLTKKWSE